MSENSNTLTLITANSAIGVFDSGMGGLTTVQELRHALPNERIVYFGDTGRVPYGTRSREIIQKYVKQDIQFLLSCRVKLIIAACNTASTVLQEALLTLDLKDEISIVEVISPAASAAKAATKNGKIGVIGTTATIKSGAYQGLLTKQDGFTLYEQACPLFVPLVENGFVQSDNKVTRLVAEGYLSPLRSAGIDTLILGCTHYPILKSAIIEVMGDKVTLIDSGKEAVSVAKEKLEKTGLLLKSGKGRVDCFVSDSVSHFRENVAVMMASSVAASSDFTLETVEQIDIEKI